MKDKTIRRGVVIAAIATASWFALASPQREIAQLIWPHDAAPWEKVVAVYYPDRTNTKDLAFAGEELSDVQSCKESVKKLASEKGDPDLEKGSYICAIGFYPDKKKGNDDSNSQDIRDQDVGAGYRLLIHGP